MKKNIIQIFLIFSLLSLFATCKQKSDTNQTIETNSETIYEANETESMKMHDKLLSSFNPDWETTDPAPEDYPEYFGGAFLNHDGKLVVAIVGNVEAEKQKIEEIIGTDDFLVESCTFSYREMMQVMDKIDEFLSKEKPDSEHPFTLNFAGAVADVFENRVIVKLVEINDAITESFRRDISDSKAVQFEEGEMPQLM